MDGKRTLIRKDLLKPCLTCPLCDTLLKEATGNSKCSHTFCRKCIYSMIAEEGIKSCPVCEIDWGTNPVEKMRLDLTLQSLRNKIFPLDKETGKAPEVVPSVQSAAKGKEKEKAPSPLGVSSLIVSVENVDELLEFDSDTILSSLSSSDMTLSPFEDDQSTDEGAKNGANAESHEARLDTQERMEVNDSGSQVQKAKRKGKKDKRKVNDKKTSTGRKKKHVCGGSSKSPQEVLDAMLLRNDSFWFNLVASGNQEGALVPLPQIRSPYIRVKDGSTTVLLIQKYLKQKLGLESENEIEIKCNRISVHPTMQIRDLLQSWLDTVSTEERITATMGSSAKEFVVVLTYGRRKVPNQGSELWMDRLLAAILQVRAAAQPHHTSIAE